MTFEKFTFTPRQINKYYQAALNDLKIAAESNLPEVSFRFGYDALLKLAIALCADNSFAGHRATPLWPARGLVSIVIQLALLLNINL